MNLKTKTRSIGKYLPSRWFSTACSVMLTILLITSPAVVSAHQQKAGLTRILFNPNTGNIEVMHRFFVHDAEHASGIIFGEEQNLLESADSRELFSSYVINRFAIQATDETNTVEELRLTYIGSEVDGQYIWVYQEIADSWGLTSLSIVNMALRDVWPEQVNLVNIEKEGVLQSLSFEQEIEVLSVNF